MNKDSLIAAMAEKASELTKKQCEMALNAFVESVSEALAKEDKVTLIGFGTFSVVERAARTGRNPSTGEPMEIPAKKFRNLALEQVLKIRWLESKVVLIRNVRAAVDVRSLIQRAFLLATIYQNKRRKESQSDVFIGCFAKKLWF